MMVGKDGHADVRMEVICSLDLWIWSFQFGIPVSMNDLNVLVVSSNFSRMLAGIFPQISSRYKIGEKDVFWY